MPVVSSKRSPPPADPAEASHRSKKATRGRPRGTVNKKTLRKQQQAEACRVRFTKAAHHSGIPDDSIQPNESRTEQYQPRAGAAALSNDPSPSSVDHPPMRFLTPPLRKVQLAAKLPVAPPPHQAPDDVVSFAVQAEVASIKSHVDRLVNSLAESEVTIRRLTDRVTFLEAELAFSRARSQG
ncbi:hypothetical protein PCASD_06285 [Puccinia coronata f. sp. avenae]|uniref:Uncharacterized protein n=1 Tax=Puccinia coronata f. sp. avenae TaxID=200324 RepID=A0A2N5V6N7_9BASI|nr:hypothetical protein PCASD_06285 [Puccinia coronata f. sp. avenae]